VIIIFVVQKIVRKDMLRKALPVEERGAAMLC
jgi:hypothetical protein